MEQILKNLIALVVCLDMGIILYKGIVRRNFGIASAIAPMLFFLGVVFYDNVIGTVNSLFYYIGLLLVFFGVFLSDIFIIISAKFKLETYASGLVDLLRNLQSKYEFVVSHVPVGIYVINSMGRFEFVNKSFCDFVGYTEQELLQMTIYELIPDNNLVEIKKNLKRRISGLEDSSEYNTTIISKDGTIISVRVNAKKTTNGHTTVTGSITPLGV